MLYLFLPRCTGTQLHCYSASGELIQDRASPALDAAEESDVSGLLSVPVSMSHCCASLAAALPFLVNL